MSISRTHISRDYAMKHGFTIDDDTKPPVAYKGPRFAPTEFYRLYERDAATQAQPIQKLPPGVEDIALRVLNEGAKTHPPGTWENTSVSEHIVHASEHMIQFSFGDTSEDHLAHAMVRLMFAVSLQNKTKGE
jgi:hypothetical protein